MNTDRGRHLRRYEGKENLMKRIGLHHVIILILIAATALAVAQEAKQPIRHSIPELLDKARAAAEAEDWDAVIENCQKVIDLAQEKQGDILTRLFPKPPEGWTREDPDVTRLNLSSEGQSFANINITCRYIKKVKDGDAEKKIVIEALVTNMKMAVETWKNMLNMKQNAQVMKMMGIEIFDRDGFRCMKHTDPNKTERSETGLFGFGKSTMLHVHGPAASAGEVESIFNLFDLKKVLK